MLLFKSVVTAVCQVFIKGTDFYYEIFKPDFDSYYYEIWLCNPKYGIKDFCGGYEFHSDEEVDNYLNDNFEPDKDYYLYDFGDLR